METKNFTTEVEEKVEVVMEECTSKKKKDGDSFTVGDALVLIAFSALVLIACWGVGRWASDTLFPRYILPAVSNSVDWVDHISPDLEFREYEYRRDGYIARTGEDDKLLDHVDWVQVGRDRDSVAVYSRYGKRGYINRYTGQIVVPETFSKGWVFSEGLAAVVLNNRLKFIDRNGKIVIDKELTIGTQAENFLFQDGHCKVYATVSGKAGLIGRDGSWCLPAECDGLDNYDKVWLFVRNGRYGLYHNDKGIIFEPEYRHIQVVGDYVLVQQDDNVVSKYDLEGNMLTELVIFETDNLVFPTNKVAEFFNKAEVNYEMGVADCLVYKVETAQDGTFCGLMDKQGNCITKPLYKQIDAIAKDRYLTYPQGTVLDNRGKETEYYKVK